MVGPEDLKDFQGANHEGHQDTGEIQNLNENVIKLA
jgi:hypothetical protein